jgi:beta-barrel assembly-enhancing protease
VRTCVRFALTLFLVFVSGCAQMSPQEELALGRKTHGQFEAESGGLYPDANVQAYVSGVGIKMARYAGRPELDWQFHVVNATQINAFAVPGGYIYITQGLLFRLSNEAQLAGVLGHECGHIAHRHSVRQIQRAQTARGLSAVAGVVGGLFGYGIAGDVTSLVASISLMKYGRDQEKDADMAALRYASEAGYSPRGLVQAMEILKKAGGSKGGPQFLSTHPDPGNRVEYLTETIEQKYRGPAETGEFGEENFRRNVLERRR